jgi:hypothetical protein
MSGYYFAPMMRVHCHYVLHPPTRPMLAATLQSIRSRYGARQAKAFRNSLLYVGSYPIR